MKINLGILDFNGGNLKSIIQIFNKLPINFNLKLISKSNDLKNIDKLILPGQGSMFNCVNHLITFDLFEKLKNFNKPIFGICIGKHIFFEKSDEGNCFGLFKFNGFIKKFNFKSYKYKLPHLGWNRVKFINNHNLLLGISNLSFFYFANSFYLLNQDLKNTYGITKYKFNFSSIFIKNNIFLTQFHPEKSSYNGLKLFYNFSFWDY